MSLAEVFSRFRRTRLSDELRTDWGHAVLYRPVSLIAGHLLARTSISPMQVTLLGGLSIPLMFAAALTFDPTIAVPIICLLAYVGGLLDCIDGDLARESGRISRLGAYVDFQIDMVRWSTFYVATGLAADRLFDGSGGVWIAVGAIAGWLRMFSRSARDFRAADDARAAGSQTEAAASTRRADRNVIMAYVVAAVSGCDGTLPFLLVFGWWLGAGGSILLVPLSLACLDLIYTQAGNISHLRR